MWSLHTVVNNGCHHKTNDNRWFPALTNTVCRFDIREDKFQTHRFGRDKNRQLKTWEKEWEEDFAKHFTLRWQNKKPLKKKVKIDRFKINTDH